MNLTLGSIVLPPDLEWTDEFSWLPVAQQIEVASDGALWIEESVQQAGRPITIEARENVWVTRAQVLALQALAAAPLAAPLALVIADGRTFSVRFRYSDGPAVEAAPVRYAAPAVDLDYYTLTLRLMQV